MDMLFLFGIIGCIALVVTYAFLFRRIQKSAQSQDKLIERAKKRAEAIIEQAHIDARDLEESLHESRARMIAHMEKQLIRDESRIREMLEREMKQYAQKFIERIDAKEDELMQTTLREIDAYRSRKIEGVREQVDAAISRAAKTALARGLNLSVHEEIVDRAIEEALREYHD